jgi:hypothetical protein
MKHIISHVYLHGREICFVLGIGFVANKFIFLGSIDVRLRVADGNKFCRFIGNEKKGVASPAVRPSADKHTSLSYTRI